MGPKERLDTQAACSTEILMEALTYKSSFAVYSSFISRIAREAIYKKKKKKKLIWLAISK